DLLQVAQSSQAKVVCGNLTVSDVPQGISGVPCPADKSLLIYRGDLVIDVMGGQDKGSLRNLSRRPHSKELLLNEQRIRELGLPDASTRLLIVYLYESEALFEDAIDLLEKTSRTLREPAPARLLGDLYSDVHEWGHAARQYSLALELSKKASDLEGQALC